MMIIISIIIKKIGSGGMANKFKFQKYIKKSTHSRLDGGGFLLQNKGRINLELNKPNC